MNSLHIKVQNNSAAAKINRIMFNYQHFKKLIFLLPPETAHNLAIQFLHFNLLPGKKPIQQPILSQNIHNLSFQNPVGMAAGFDKNAQALKNLSKQGFGFIEAGTVTLKPQAGYKKPRIFRLPQAESIINRLGFNNKGLEYFRLNLQKHQKNTALCPKNLLKRKNKFFLF